MHKILSFLFGFGVLGRIFNTMQVCENQIQQSVNIEAILERQFDNKKPVSILLDYDGTLTPIVSHPDLAVIPPETKETLSRLANMPNVFIAIISGRAVTNVKEMVGIPNITYAGNHGFEISFANGQNYSHEMGPELEGKYNELVRELKRTMEVNNCWVEDKGTSLTFHYRNCPEPLKPEVEAAARKIMDKSGFRINSAHQALEVKPPIHWHKGTAADYILKNTFGPDWHITENVIFAGDDTTDEDIMTALKGRALSFRISQNPNIETAADHVIPTLDYVVQILKWIGKKMCARACGHN